MDIRENLERFTVVLEGIDFKTNIPQLLKNSSLFGTNHHHLIFPLFFRGEIFSLVIFIFQSEREAINAKEGYAKWMADMIPLLEAGYKYTLDIQEGRRSDLLLARAP